MPLVDANAIHPITLPDGTLYRDTVYLKTVIDHPRMEIGEYSYYTHSGKPDDTAKILAPYLGHSVRERLVIGKFVQIARVLYHEFCQSSDDRLQHLSIPDLQTRDLRLQGPASEGYSGWSRRVDRP